MRCFAVQVDIKKAGRAARYPVQNWAMDDIVQQALIKWPNVPHCYGWLGLDARGRWFLRDDAAQAQGAFPQSKGELLKHAKLIAFIERNYEADAQGQWFFQNGPQRVYVELECTPWIWRIELDGSLLSHTGRTATAKPICLLDDEGRVYVASDIGLGLVHTLDVAQVADAIECGDLVIQAVCADNLSAQYGFVCSPASRNASR
jgi:hypothetical protein